MSPRKVVAQELSRERILDEARELFVHQGYRNLTMRSIARAMGYSHGALYYHFEDKADLFYALIQEDFHLLLATLKDLLPMDGPGDREDLKRLMLHFIRFGLEHPHHYEIMFLLRDADLQSHAGTTQARSMELFNRVVQDTIAGLPDAANRQFSASWSLFYAMHGFISHSIHYGQTYEDVERFAEQYVEQLCQGLLANGRQQAYV
ncbi:TetR family transcriptional regulator [Paenibacillus sp. J31TS4]|uniref:TetR/AcrR family transcriptional regulator n=1 Tax=Paenibacillus sp. J31TS4 TaxID=2807195 RepID=UPI001B25D666|nr:TetR/AcrR family transcriptional regulator [Paenibacillus sp. J31TS4]GIP38931.1 TetR family transcriptional regulator [Paenibacillus sp. J31TS4]